MGDVTEAESVPWSGVTGKPSAFTPSSHSHGSITNDGKVGTASGRPLITAVFPPSICRVAFPLLSVVIPTLFRGAPAPGGVPVDAMRAFRDR